MTQGLLPAMTDPDEKTPSLTAALALAGSLFVLSLAYGLSFGMPLEREIAMFRVASAVFLLLLLVAVMSIGQGVAGRPGRGWVAWLGASLAMAMLLCSAYLQLPTLVAGGFGAGVLSVAALWLWWSRLRPAETRSSGLADLTLLAGWLLAFGIVVRALLHGEPLPHDMLPFVDRALATFLGGGNPYQMDVSDISGNLFFYLPGQWLGYLPAAVAGLDLRWLNLLLAAVAFLLVRWLVRTAPNRDAARLVLYPTLLSYPVIETTVGGQVWIYWWVIIALALALLKPRALLVVLLIGVALATRQTAILFAGAVALYFWGRIPPWRFALYGLVAVGIWLGAFMPFADGNLPGLLREVYLERPLFAIDKAPGNGNPANQISLIGFLDPQLVRAWASVLQLALAVVFLALAWRWRRWPTAWLLVALGFFDLLEMSLGGFTHRYYYITGFLLIGIGVAGVGRAVGCTPAIADFTEPAERSSSCSENN